MSLPQDVMARFWAKVDVRSESECWHWTACLEKPNGYGRFMSRHGGPVPAHRFAWLITFGEIPPEILVCHRCDNAVCVNPSHLFLGTHAANMADKKAKGRQYKPVGTAHPSAKLQDHSVRRIKILFGALTCKDIGKLFGVGHGCIDSIFRGDNWTHIQPWKPALWLKVS